MPVHVRCPACTATLRVQPGDIGRVIRCPRCGVTIKPRQTDAPSPPVAVAPEPLPLEDAPVRPPQKPRAYLEPRANPEPKPAGAAPQTLVLLGGLAALACTLVVGCGVGGFLLYQKAGERDTKGSDEIAAAPPATRTPAAQPPAPKSPTTPSSKVPPDLVTSPQPVMPTGPAPAAGKTTTPTMPETMPVAVRLPGVVTEVYPADGGKLLTFRVPQARMLAVYDVAGARPSGSVLGLDDQVQVSIARDKAIFGQPDGRLVRLDLRTGTQEATFQLDQNQSIRYLAAASGADAPLMVVGNAPVRRVLCQLFDPLTFTPLAFPVADPQRPTQAFPLILGVEPLPPGVSANGRTMVVGDRALVRTRDGYKGVEVNQSSGLIPSPDGKVLLGHSLVGEDGRQLRPGDRTPNMFFPAGAGPFFLQVEYGPKYRLLLHANQDAQPLAELPGGAAVKEWMTKGKSPTGLPRVVTFLPDPGMVVVVSGNSNEAQLFPVDMPDLLRRAGRDVLFTSVAPAVPRGNGPYTYTATAVAADGARPTFALVDGPPGLTVTPDGSVTWFPRPGQVRAPVPVRIAARTAGGKEAVQEFTITPPTIQQVLIANNVTPKGPGPGPIPPPFGQPNLPFPPQSMPPPLVPKKVEPPPPPVLAGPAPKEVPLPAAVASVAVGGSGRYVCAYLPTTRQVAVFDATQQKVVKYLPAGGANVFVAAGAEKLFVVSPVERVVQRWSLTTFEKELTVPLPASVTTPGGLKREMTVKNALVGSASTGPLWLTDSGAVVALDTRTLQPIGLTWDKGNRGVFVNVGEGVRVSADGRTLGSWGTSGSPSGFSVLTLGDATLKPHYEHESLGHVTPGPDGRVIYTACGRFSPTGKDIGGRDGVNGFAPQGTMYSIPAAEGSSLYLNLTLGKRGTQQPATAAVHWAADGTKLADLPGLALGDINVWDREAIGHDQRLMLLPAAKQLVVLPPTNDKLLVYPFDLDAALEKSGKDYLLVDSPAALVAARGKVFTHALSIRSKKGGVKVKVDSAPAGFAAAADGKLTWAVPKGYADDDAVVILTVSDASGQESLHTLRVAVGAEKGATVAVAPMNPAPMNPAPMPKMPDPPPAVPGKADPPPPDAGPVTVKLPAAASAVAVGAGGKLMAFHLPQQRQVAVLDVAQAKVVKYIPVAEDGALIAAGQTHLFVANPNARVLLRINLTTFEREATVPLPITGTVSGLCMGSASKGPLLVCVKGDQWGAKPLLVDPITLKVIPGGDKLPTAVGPFARASADGRLFGWRNSTGSEGHDMSLVEVVNGEAKGRSFGAGTSLLLPSPDGRYIYCAQGVFNSQFKKLYPSDENGNFNRPYLPAASGNLFMQLEPGGGGGRFPGDPQAKPAAGRVNFFLPGQYRAFASMDGIEGVATESYSYGSVGDPVMHDRRLTLVPDAGRLVSIPATNDRVVLHRFNVDELLQKSDVDYLLVTTEPPAEAHRGTTFAYTPAVRSRKGGVNLKHEIGPDGMALAAGNLTWKVPADHEDGDVDVILSVTDSAGQELFQTFKLAVRDRPANAPMPAPEPAPAPAPPAPPPPMSVPAPLAPKVANPPATGGLALRPAPLDKDEQTVNLPSPAAQIIPAAGGRFLLAHLPRERKLAVFDTAAAKVVKYLPIPEEEAHFAAGRDKLIVLLPGANVVQRWDLKTLERELTTANPITSPVKSLTMGNASAGPLVVVTRSAAGAFDMPGVQLYDVKTLKKSDLAFGDGGRGAGGFHPQYPPEVRVSANGETITAWVLGLSPSGVHVWAREGKTYRAFSEHESWGALLPDADGRTVYAARKAITNGGKALAGAPAGLAVPAVHGSLVLGLDVGDPFGGGQRGPARASVYLDRESRPLVTLPALAGLDPPADRFGRSTRGYDQRVFLIPDAKLLITVPDAGDKLILHRFDLDAQLEKARIDYLFVAGRPPAEVVAGTTFRYSPTVRSKKGGARVRLESGPEGMRLGADGVVTWAVPAAAAGTEADVILTVTDSTGQELFHTFKLGVTGPAARQ